jgi:hypothetical protein
MVAPSAARGMILKPFVIGDECHGLYGAPADG